MSRISSTGITTSAGLVSGIPIEETVNQLLQISARPRDQLVTRNQGLSAERAAIDQITSLTLGTSLSLNQLSLRRTFTGRLATTSNENALRASIDSSATPAVGSYQFTPLRQATASQFVSQRIEDVSDLGSGTLSFRFGGRIDEGRSLEELNAGEGIADGQIKITDRAGQSAIIDLRGAQTIDDVIATINSTVEIDVVASTDGDTLVLTDDTGDTGTLRVREVNGGTTAASLGILGSAAGDTLTGSDILGLGRETQLSSLRDGLGVRISSSEDADIRITLADGSTADIDLSGASTLGDVFDAIAAESSLSGLTVGFNAQSNALELTDSTIGTQLVIEDLDGGSIAADLGIATAGVTGTLTGDRLISGLQDTLVSSLNGGAGVTGGSLDITDADSNTVNVDLSAAADLTVAELVAQINSDAVVAGAGVTATVNDAGNGILLTDTSGGAGSLTVADNATATDLGLVGSATGTTLNSGSLNRQLVGLATRLEDFNGGRGVAIADIRVTDSSGASALIDLNAPGSEAETIGDVIDAINANATISVTASINATGDGILLTDTADGSSVLSVEEAGSGSAAADLGLLGDSTTTNGSNQQTIDGSTSFTVDLSGLDDSAAGTTLSSLNSGEGVDLGVFQVTAQDGTSFVVDLGKSTGVTDAETIQDVIDRINAAAGAAGASVTASLNSAESGIVLSDTTATADIEQALTVTDLGSDTAAADLRLIRSGDDTDDAEIEGAGLFSSSSDSGLETLVDRINALGAGVTASVFNDGQGSRLSIISDQTGSGSELVIDGSAADLSFLQTSRAADAVGIFGGLNGVGGFAVTSSTNEFSGVIDGVTLTAGSELGQTVTIDIASDDAPITDAVQGFIDAYNSLQSNLDVVTDFDEESETTGILFGRGEIVRLETDLSRLVTARYNTGSSINTLQQVGITLGSDGQLSLDTGRLQEALDSSPEAVEALFRDETNGAVAQFEATIDQLASDQNSVLGARSATLARTIESNEARIDRLNESLDRERERLLLEFIQLEETIALLQSNTSAIDSIQPISIASSSSNNS